MDFKGLTPKQKKGRDIIFKNQYNQILFDGGARSGKTFLIVLALIMLCVMYDGLRVLMARLRFNHAKASLWMQTLEPMLKTICKNVNAKINRSDFIIKIGNSEIWLGGLDDKERTEKILGQEFGIIYPNEATQISKGTRDILLTRLAQNIPGFTNFMIYDCNPRHPLHYLYQEFYVEKSKLKAVLKFLPKDNIKNLPKGYITNILGALKGDKKKRFLEGIWCQVPGAVHDNIHAEKILDLSKDFNYYDDIVLGMDFGIYSCFTVWGIKDHGRTAYCIYERIVLNGKTSDLIKKLDEIWGIKEWQYPIYCDHEPDRIQEIQDAGYNALKAYKEVGAGDSSVNDCELFFDTCCQSTFQSMLNLVHKQDANGNFIDGHVKENDHEDDASRYAIHGWKKDNKAIEPVFIKGF